MLKIENESEVNRLIDLEFLKPLAEKYGIVEVCVDDDPIFPLRDDIARIEYGFCSGRYHLRLNQRIDKEKAAAFLRLRTGLKIRPDEVYYYAIFHEIGHIYDKESPFNAGALAARPFFLNKIYPPTGKLMTWDQIKLDKLRAEELANEFAKREFKKWRARKKKI